MDISKQIIDVAVIIADLKKRSDTLAGVVLLNNVSKGLNTLSSEMWNIYYYYKDSDGKDCGTGDDNPVNPIYQMVNKVQSRINNIVSNGDIFENVPEDLPCEFEGKIKSSSRW